MTHHPQAQPHRLQPDPNNIYRVWFWVWPPELEAWAYFIRGVVIHYLWVYFCP